MRSEAGPICVVVADAGGLNELAGPARHVLDCTDGPRRTTSPRHHYLDDLAPTTALISQIHDCPPADRVDRVLLALRSLNRSIGFRQIVFPARGGLGFRTIQAKSAGLDFEDVELIIRTGELSRTHREREQSWPAGPDDLILDYMEQYSLAHSDEAMTSTGTPLVTVGIAHYNLGSYLPAALDSLAAQAYQHIEIIVIDDGSTDGESLRVIENLRHTHPGVRVLWKANAGIGAARNRLLAEARGEFFLPMDADNLARPHMVETFVRALLRNPDCTAMTCYFEAFAGDGPPNERLYACRPTGGPHVLSCIRNVYGDANGIFRTEEFRAAGGYETDRGTSCEDWEAYVKLIHAGKRIDVVPEVLFDYRHRESGFSRATNWFANHQRVLRQFAGSNATPEWWTALLGFQQENVRLREKLAAPRYRVADALHAGLARPYRWLRRRFGTGRALPSGIP